MKQIAIVVDDYKLTMFREELMAKGFSYSVHSFTQDTSSLKISVEESQVTVVHDLCKKIQKHFADLNKGGVN